MITKQTNALRLLFSGPECIQACEPPPASVPALAEFCRLLGAPCLPSLICHPASELSARKLLRALAIMDVVPILATLVEFSGSVMFQNLESRRYYGPLVEEDGAVTCSEPGRCGGAGKPGVLPP
jgi:hypothetical protein